MKSLQQFIATASVLLLALVVTFAAETNPVVRDVLDLPVAPMPTPQLEPTPALRTATDSRILQPDTSASTATLTPTKHRPSLGRLALPPEIKEKLRQFEVARERFIRDQEALRKKLEGATTDREREDIRRRIKESLEVWREQARQFRDEARERAKELQRELPKHREALEEGKSLNQGVRPRRPGLD